MIKKTFERVDESIYIEKLDNGIEVYMYPTDKTKNFYLTISVKYGARINKYKIDDKTFDIIPGSAHFLEHKVMALSENESISKRINELGSLANAWTSYYGTNYNLFGSINPIENLKLLLDIFYNTNINEKCVNEEKGIIHEEIDMYKDQIDRYMYDRLFDNLFHTSYVKDSVLGKHSDIDKITSASLNKIYKDFYISNNTFITLCGNFDKDEMLEEIKKYMSNLKLKPKTLPKRVKTKEKETVYISYEEIKKDIQDEKVKLAIKLNKKMFGIKQDVVLKDYLSIIMSNNISPTSKLYEEYKRENIITNMGHGINIIDDYVIININAFTNDSNKFIERIKEDIPKFVLVEEEFERKKKYYLKSYITAFDNIEDIEYNITMSLMIDGKIDYNEYKTISDMNYEEALRILSLINLDNISIIKTIK